MPKRDPDLLLEGHRFGNYLASLAEFAARIRATARPNQGLSLRFFGRQARVAEKPTWPALGADQLRKAKASLSKSVPEKDRDWEPDGRFEPNN